MQDREVVYGIDHRAGLILQLNYPPPIGYIKFLNWEWSMVEETETKYLIAIWHLKQRH